MDKLNLLFKKAFNTDISGISGSSKINELKEWDSMAHMMFITRLEEVFDINLTGDEIADMQTIDDVKNILAKSGKI